MKKQERRFEISYNLDWTYGVSIEKLKADIAEVEKLGATEIEIESYSEYDSIYINVKAIARRLETDAEAKERAKAERKSANIRKAHELRQLEILKAKYGL